MHANIKCRFNSDRFMEDNNLDEIKDLSKATGFNMTKCYDVYNTDTITMKNAEELEKIYPNIWNYIFY